jgi:hypothetical protein
LGAGFEVAQKASLQHRVVKLFRFPFLVASCSFLYPSGENLHVRLALRMACRKGCPIRIPGFRASRRQRQR